LSEAIVVNVDDSEVGRYTRSRILREAGFAVYEAGTGADALRLVDELRPEIVLLDVNLPDADGTDICALIKGREASPATIVLQITASATSAPQATKALNRGADCYIIEPIDPDVLVATVRAFLRLRGAEHALAIANRALQDKNAELQVLNQALRRSNNDLEHFAYIASHDLQEPLRNITTHIQLLERTVADRFEEGERRLFRVVADGAQRMSSLIRDVLAYSAMGRHAPQFSPMSLDESLFEALRNLAERISSTNAAITSRHLPTVTGDPTQLTQVFQNLIGNSIKYHREGAAPEIDITAERTSAREWLIRTRDNGIGIEESHLEMIFQPFKRLHGRSIPGNGIGLALCRRIVENHGGRIWAESREGEGTTFLFTLPAASDLRAAELSGEVQGSPPGGIGKP